MRAGAVGRFAAMEVKLNGVTAKTKPSRGRYSSLFQTPGAERGCSSRILCPQATLNRQKSTISQAESISAWEGGFDCPSMVAPLSVGRHPAESRSAALRKTAARSWNGVAAQLLRAF